MTGVSLKVMRAIAEHLHSLHPRNAGISVRHRRGESGRPQIEARRRHQNRSGLSAAFIQSMIEV